MFLINLPADAEIPYNTTLASVFGRKGLFIRPNSIFKVRGWAAIGRKAGELLQSGSVNALYHRLLNSHRKLSLAQCEMVSAIGLHTVLTLIEDRAWSRCGQRSFKQPLV